MASMCFECLFEVLEDLAVFVEAIAAHALILRQPDREGQLVDQKRPDKSLSG
jgi:hypothetical protein